MQLSDTIMSMRINPNISEQYHKLIFTITTVQNGHHPFFTFLFIFTILFFCSPGFSYKFSQSREMPIQPQCHPAKAIIALSLFGGSHKEARLPKPNGQTIKYRVHAVRQARVPLAISPRIITTLGRG
jgi:hypothetical protein